MQGVEGCTTSMAGLEVGFCNALDFATIRTIGDEACVLLLGSTQREMSSSDGNAESTEDPGSGASSSDGATEFDGDSACKVSSLEGMTGDGGNEAYFSDGGKESM